jgi:hypothetical protein
MTNEIIELANKIGELLVKQYPPNPGTLGVPSQHAVFVSNDITAVVAEILQSYLDAGSERDVTIEELGPAIEAHVQSWVDETPFLGDDNAVR